VRAVFDDDQAAAGDGFVGALAAVFEGHDGVAVAVDDQGRYVDLGEVAAEVGEAEGGDAVQGALG
jgi:hypothetical protein